MKNVEKLWEDLQETKGGTMDIGRLLKQKNPEQKAGPIQMAEEIGNQAMLRRTGIPEGLKARVEERSGVSLDSVRVHYNSPAPAAVQAYAYTQGNQIYLGPGQEKHLGHELGHVVQQMQGRVRPTGSVNGLPLNDDVSLEREADTYR